MASMLVMLLLGQTVAFDLSKLWPPGDVIEKGKFDILLMSAYTFVHIRHTAITIITITITIKINLACVPQNEN